MFSTLVILAAIAGLLIGPLTMCQKPAQKPEERKPNPTPYTGPLYTPHGREIAPSDPRRPC